MPPAEPLAAAPTHFERHVQAERECLEAIALAQTRLDAARCNLAEDVAELLHDSPRSCGAWRARLGARSAVEREAQQALLSASAAYVAEGHRWLRQSGACPACGESIPELLTTCANPRCRGCLCDGCRP